MPLKDNNRLLHVIMTEAVGMPGQYRLSASGISQDESRNRILKKQYLRKLLISIVCITGCDVSRVTDDMILR